MPKVTWPKTKYGMNETLEEMKSWNISFEINQSLKEMNTQKNLAMKNILMKLKTWRMQSPMKVPFYELHKYF